MNYSKCKGLLLGGGPLLVALALLATPAHAESQDLSIHSRVTRTPIGVLSHQEESFQQVMAPFVEQCREVGNELYQKHADAFPYSPDGHTNLPQTEALYLPGIKYNTVNRNLGALMHASLYHGYDAPMELTGLAFLGKPKMREIFAGLNQDYVGQRGGPIIRCDLWISGHVGTGIEEADSPLIPFMDRQQVQYRLNRHKLSFLIDQEQVLLISNELYASLNQEVKVEAARIIHQKRAELLSDLNEKSPFAQAESFWRTHGAYASVGLGETIIYRCHLQVDNDRMNSSCGLEPSAISHFMPSLEDGQDLAQRIEFALNRVRAQMTGDINKF